MSFVVADHFALLAITDSLTLPPLFYFFSLKSSHLLQSNNTADSYASVIIINKPAASLGTLLEQLLLHLFSEAIAST
ncbi:hypothetical protein K1719_041674 [Acacia pycnantha]|nr:hypothetical protein K1719_041674 [Acacia pycnantha]